MDECPHCIHWIQDHDSFGCTIPNCICMYVNDEYPEDNVPIWED